MPMRELRHILECLHKFVDTITLGKEDHKAIERVFFPRHDPGGGGCFLGPYRMCVCGFVIFGIDWIGFYKNLIW